jgi:hypothetical protein
MYSCNRFLFLLLASDKEKMILITHIFVARHAPSFSLSESTQKKEKNKYDEKIQVKINLNYSVKLLWYVRS